MAIAVRGHPRGAAQRGRTFADVPPGAVVVLVDSTGSAALCINGGDAARELRLAVGDDVELRLAERLTSGTAPRGSLVRPAAR